MSDSKYRKAQKETVTRRRALMVGGVVVILLLLLTRRSSEEKLLKGETPDVPRKVYSASEEDDFVYYFAYASDLLQARIRIGCPSAENVAVASLESYRFGYTIFSKVWKGGR